jgi:Protein of unknown function (DUF3311)
MSSPPRTSRKSPVAIGIAGVLLLAAVIGSFWVPLYARSTPKLGAFPFFYWYQLILVPAVAIISWIAYLLVRTDGAGTAEARPGQAPDGAPGAVAGPVPDAAPGAGAGPEVTR